MALALSFALSTMTGLRFAGLPVGVAELIVLLCLVVHLPLGFGVHGGNPPSFFLPFLTVIFFAALPGFIITLNSEGLVDHALYSLVASIWILLLFAYLHYGFDYSQVDIAQLVNIFLLLSCLYFAVVLVLSFVEPSLVYLGDDIADRLSDARSAQEREDAAIFRLVGFSTNPNQIAFHALIASVFAVQLWKRNGSVYSLIALALAFAVGFLGKSDAFLFAEVALIGVAIVAGIIFGRSYILALVIIVPAVFFAVVALPTAMNSIQEIASSGDQDATRYNLWANGITSGLERPLTGLGPGAWSGLEGPRGVEEAHNTVIDYFSNTGIIGGAIMVLGILAISFRSIIRLNANAAAGLAALLVFCTFHNMVRHPLLWLAVYYIAHQLWPGVQEMSKQGRKRSRQRRKMKAR